jgi:hypothetical protein
MRLGDYRYIRTTKDFTLGDYSINNQKLDFSGATAGVVFQFCCEEITSCEKSFASSRCA